MWEEAVCWDTRVGGATDVFLKEGMLKLLGPVS